MLVHACTTPPIQLITSNNDAFRGLASVGVTHPRVYCIYTAKLQGTEIAKEKKKAFTYTTYCNLPYNYTHPLSSVVALLHLFHFSIAFNVSAIPILRKSELPACPANK
jgi:hypothetical protein